MPHLSSLIPLPLGWENRHVTRSTWRPPERLCRRRTEPKTNERRPALTQAFGRRSPPAERVSSERGKTSRVAVYQAAAGFQRNDLRAPPGSANGSDTCDTCRGRRG